MKKTYISQIVTALLLLTAVSGQSQTTFFSDGFTNGSTVNAASPMVPNTNAANYVIVSSKSWSPSPAVTANDFKYGIAATTSGSVESQSLFTTNTINLVMAGDYVQLAVVFTNTAGILTSNNLMGFGLYSTGQTNPVNGGLNGTATATSAAQTSGTLDWAGYVGQISFNGGNSRIMTRAQQTGTTANDQDLVTSGSGSSSYGNPGAGGVSGNFPSTVIMTNGFAYLDVLSITLLSAGNEAITNTLYAGTTTNSPVFAQFGGVASGGTFMTSAFDGLAIGWRATSSGSGPTTIDVSSIQVSGHESIITGPPTITTQPNPAVAATNGYAEYTVAAIGANVTYRWYGNGVPLVNGGDLSGVSTTKLVVSPCQSADALSGANGYYCKVSGFGGFSTNSVTNSLTLYPATNLIWAATGASPVWDVDTTANFVDTNNNAQVFIGGDAVTIQDNVTGGINTAVNLVGDLAPSTLFMTNSSAITLQGSGSIVGPGSVTCMGNGNTNASSFILNVNNFYTGGTIFTNGAYINLKNYGALGTGPVYLDDESATMEFFSTGSANVGINGPVNINADYNIQLDNSGSFAGVFLGNVNGVPGVTLSFNDATGIQTNRVRFYGTNSVCNSGIALNGPSVPNQALYYGMQFAPYNATGTQTFNGVISGNGGVVQRGSGNSVFTGQNTYNGGTFPTAGNLGIGADSIVSGGSLVSGPFGTNALVVAPEAGSSSGTGTIFASGSAHTIANPVIYPSNTNNQTLAVGGTNALTLTGNIALNGADGSLGSITRTFSIGNTALTTFSGVISDGGQNCNLTKTGTGVLALTGTETYTGTNTVSAGTLLVNGTIGAGPVNVNSGGTLSGSGTVGGLVTLNSGGNITPGNQAIGTLTINNTLSMQGNSTNRFTISKTGSLNSVINATSVNYYGTLSVTNIAGTLVLGDSFTIFNAGSHSGNFTNIVGSLSSGLAWSFNPTNGVLSVVTGVIVPNVPPKISSVTLASANVTITATNGVNGGTYYLLGATNLASPISQWVPLSTNVVTTSGGSATFTFIGTNVVSVSLPQQYYRLSSTNN